MPTVSANRSKLLPSCLSVALDGQPGPWVQLMPAGTFTGRSLANAGDNSGLGIQPALAPRYLIEVMPPDNPAGGGMVTANTGGATASGAKASTGSVYRITAMGFGPRSNVQAVLQTIYRN